VCIAVRLWSSQVIDY